MEMQAPKTDTYDPARGVCGEGEGGGCNLSKISPRALLGPLARRLRERV
jgi:hypothetical protein